jgi:NAD(P)-dependent dehydrogenase (short-subunit alcohol dehydrogenase family)
MEKIELSEKKTNWIIGATLGVGALAALVALGKSRRHYDFKNKTVLITGGSRGLGLLMARELAGQGARVAVCARNSEELKRAEDDLRNYSTEVFQIVCNVGNQMEVDGMIEAVRSRFGQIDVLINNAGIIQVGPLEVQTQKDFEDAMAVHFWGPFFTMQAVIPEMKRRGEGRIVNVSSIGGKMAIPHFAPYCASKFALVGLSSAMRIELEKDNIFVTTVCPGLMRTGSHVNATFKGQNEKEYAWLSIGNALPVSSISGKRAARQIIEACRRGDAEAVVSIQARIAIKMNALFPELISEVSALVNQILPDAGGIGKGYARGKDSASLISPSILTALSDKEAYQNNELKPEENLT